MRVVLHGHFYQPPRENPWTGEIPRQRGARPYHDWNERITDECYRANGWSRVLGAQGRIAAIVNGYEHLSFDFGPTLLRDLAHRAPTVYDRILEADRRSVDAHGGHGNAFAQSYNHTILPLTSERDRRTQIRWGLRDFEARFGRKSEGLWLPETAIDAATLRALIEEGVRFIVLAPHQAKRVRRSGDADWREVQPQHPVETGFAYRCYLPEDAGQSGRDEGGVDRGGPDRPHVDVFFYDGSLSVAVSFNHLLRSAEDLAGRLQQAGRQVRGGLVHLATDGEIYGHHERYGDMCLAYFATREAPSRRLKLTNYGEELAEHPPVREVELNYGDGEGTAWSCAHGVGRWVRHCGCTTTSEPGWSQAWRTPLRVGLDTIRDEIQRTFEAECAELLRDPWAARDGYIEVLLAPRNEHDAAAEAKATAARGAFLERHAARPLQPAERRRVWSLLEATHHAMLMNTSCAWFFSDVSGLEVRQNLAYAARACELAQPYTRSALEPMLLEHLREARSNVPRWRDGEKIYQSVVRRRLTAPHVAAQAAVEAAFLARTLPRVVHGYAIAGETHRDGERASGRLALTDLASESHWEATWRLQRGEGGREIVLHADEIELTYSLRQVLEALPSDLRRELGRRLRAQQLVAARDWLERMHQVEDSAWPELPAGRSPLARAIEQTIRGWEVEALAEVLAREPETFTAIPEEWWRRARRLARRGRRRRLRLPWEGVGRHLATRIERGIVAAAVAPREERDLLLAEALSSWNEAGVLGIPIHRTRIEERAYDLGLELPENEPTSETVQRLADVANLDLDAIRGDELRRSARL